MSSAAQSAKTGADCDRERAAAQKARQRSVPSRCTNEGLDSLGTAFPIRVDAGDRLRRDTAVGGTDGLSPTRSREEWTWSPQPLTERPPKSYCGCDCLIVRIILLVSLIKPRNGQYIARYGITLPSSSLRRRRPQTEDSEARAEPHTGRSLCRRGAVRGAPCLRSKAAQRRMCACRPCSSYFVISTVN